jgi:purine-binding chemotaxis protein CheW
VPDSSRLSAPLDANLGFDILEPHSSRPLLVFQLADRFAALPLEDVERIAPMAELACPPGLPSVLEGVLNLAGAAIPVLRLDRLFELRAQRLGLYSMLVILKALHGNTIAILVDRVSGIFPVPENAFLPIDQEDSFNGCSEATVFVRDHITHVLSPTRMLLAKERVALSEFQAAAQRRLQDWEAGLA